MPPPAGAISRRRWSGVRAPSLNTAQTTSRGQDSWRRTRVDQQPLSLPIGAAVDLRDAPQGTTSAPRASDDTYRRSPSDGRQSALAIQRWEGVVETMLDEGFRAMLLDMDDSTVPDEETEFEFSEISDDDFD